MCARYDYLPMVHRAGVIFLSPPQINMHFMMEIGVLVFSTIIGDGWLQVVENGAEESHNVN